MKICVISTTIFPVPLTGYGGLEQVAYQQATGLANKGHQVLLVAPIGSKVPPNVELHGTTMRESEKQAYSGYWQRLSNYDVIIDNSVIGTAETLYKIGGRPKWCSISELYNDYLLRNPVIFDGKTTFIPTYDLQVMSMLPNGNIAWKSVSSIIRHQNSEELINIKTEHGNICQFTGKHAVFAAGEKEIELIGAAKTSNRIIATGKRYPAIEHKIEYFPITNIKIHHQAQPIKLPIKLTDNFLIMLGLWLGDGSYDKCSIHYSICQDQFDVIRNVAHELGLTAKLASIRPDVTIIINNAILKKLMQRGGFTGHAYTKRIPDWIFSLNKTQIGLILRGLFSSDGCARKDSYSLCVSSCNRRLLEQTRILLGMLGIPSAICTSKINENKKFKQNYQIHELSICQAYFKEFFEQVNFIDQKRSTSIQKRIVNRPCWTPDIPYFMLNYKKRRYDSDKPKHNRRSSEICGLKIDTAWLQVTTCEKLSEKPDYVYDLSVPDTENFLINNIIAHNSWEKWSYILKMEKKLKAPILGVLHAPASTMYKIPPPVKNPCFVTISKDQAQDAKTVLGIDTKTIYNGIDTEFYSPDKFSIKAAIKRWLFLARISKIKGPDIALEVAKKTGIELDIVGDDKITGEPELAAFVKAGCTQPQIIYHGGKSREESVKFFSNAICLLHMNKIFREPFGLAPIEAQACGCPVIAFDNGAMRETILPGKTGFLVKSTEEVIDLIKTNAIKNISPQACREWIVENFTIQSMVNNYEKSITEALETGGW